MNLFTINLKKVVASALLIGGVTMSAQAQLKVTGEVRTRSTVEHGALGLGTNGDADPAIFTAMRSRVYADYTMDKLDFHISLQDVRSFGATPQLYQAGNALNNESYSITNVFQAWGKYNFNETTSLKVGRQVISYDDQRYLGGLGWLEQGRVHDAFTFGYKKGSTTLTVPFSHGPQAENTAAYLGRDAYKFAFFPHLNQKFEGGQLSVLMAPVVAANAETKITTGLTGDVKAGEKVKVGGSLYYQAGKNASHQELAGMQASLFVNTKVGKSSLTLGGEYLSGDDDATDDKNTMFTPDFGTNHKFNGFMDHFYVGAAPKAGLIDLNLKTKTKIGEKSALVANAHYFMTAADAEKVYGTDDSAYGAEIDLVYVHNLGSSTKFKLGYSQFVGATETMEAYRGGGAGSGNKDGFHGYGWMMFIFKPVLTK